MTYKHLMHRIRETFGDLQFDCFKTEHNISGNYKKNTYQIYDVGT